MSEWLLTDGLGGFAMGRDILIPTRRYHALLIAPDESLSRRFALVNSVDVTITIDGENHSLSTFRFRSGAFHPDGATYISSFDESPFPKWKFKIAENCEVTYEIRMLRGQSSVTTVWKVASDRPWKLVVRPLISGRDYHALHSENSSFNFHSTISDDEVSWRPYPGVPTITARSNGKFISSPSWYRGFEYHYDATRGFPCHEDLASPGEFIFESSNKEAFVEFIAGALPDIRESSATLSTTHEIIGDHFLAKRDSGMTIIAGYPWFIDWGRDTFISIRGLCFLPKNYEQAAEIFTQWIETISEGMIPNRMTDDGSSPEYNSVDASLWFVVSGYEFIKLLEAAKKTKDFPVVSKLKDAIALIVSRYFSGTRYGIKCDDDGLLKCGEPGSQLTWMDAKVNGVPVTPRMGKPVEIQALWINALEAAIELGNKEHKKTLTRARNNFQSGFWNSERHCLFDVIDTGHRPGSRDPSIRPNQIFAVGGLPFKVLMDEAHRNSVVDTVEKRLWTPAGLRTLAVGEPGYVGRYQGEPAARDRAYHQGTAWPWLMGAFVDAWLEVRHYSSAAKKEARRRFLKPLREQRVGFHGVAEVADGDPPHAAGGCPFQAWSAAETLRIEEMCRE